MDVPALDESRLRHIEVDVGSGLRLHTVETGQGPLVVLLHGFPDFWFGWRKQIPALAAAGFRVVAPDLRGYNRSDKPPHVTDYGVRHLAADVAALVSGLGESRARVVGHDWGAGVAWALAMAHPERVDRVAVLNGPHPERFVRNLTQPSQLARSWYIFAFQLPVLPEAALRRHDFDLLVRAVRDGPVRAGAVSESDVARYREAWSQPGALTAMVNWYRAMFRPNTAVALKATQAPTLVLWGTADPYLGASLAQPNAALVPNARVELLEGASHWVQHDEPARVNRSLVDFLR
ncbi:MAG TPA: alpha/beta hydrolase [Polyangiaceae bacterium]|nr:alpha/beta hydrolase [Polyangiaceae bacterium]